MVSLLLVMTHQEMITQTLCPIMITIHQAKQKHQETGRASQCDTLRVAAEGGPENGSVNLQLAYATRVATAQGGWLAGWLAGRQAGRQAGWLAGWLLAG